MKIIVSFRSYLTRYRKFQKIAKKYKKIQKNSKTPLSLHFKTPYVEGGWKRKKIKIIVSFRTYLTHNWKFQKNSEKILKIKQYHYPSISRHHRLKEDEKGRKLKLSFRSVPTWRIIENSQKSKIIQKKKKIQLWLHFKPKSVERGWKREKIKIIVSFCSYSTRNWKFQKNSKN